MPPVVPYNIIVCVHFCYIYIFFFFFKMLSRNSAEWPTISAFLVLILFAYYVLFYVSVVIGFVDLTCERFIKINK